MGDSVAGIGVNASGLSWRQLRQAYEGKPVFPGGSGAAPGDGGEGASVRRPGAGGPGRSETDDVTAVRQDHPVPFAELWALSCYNFSGGASEPEQLVSRAVQLGIGALAVVDRDGLYGAVKFAAAAGPAGIDTVFGSELSLPGGVLCVLARGPEGYRLLSRAIADARLAGRGKDRVAYPPLDVLGHHAHGHWYVLIDAVWAPRAQTLVEAFGAECCVVVKEATMTPADADNHALLDGIARRLKLPVVLSCHPTAATAHQARLAAVKQALAANRSLSEHAPYLPPAGGRWLRGSADLLRAYPGCADHLATAADIAADCAFDLDVVAPRLPDVPVAPGHTDASWLRELVNRRTPRRYATRGPQLRRRAREQMDRELSVITGLGFDGYFLIVTDLVDFCREHNILCQGRGSAANSAVCFALGITNVEPVAAGLLFERFLSPERDGPPDIDLDIESGRREEVIQYVFDTYGRDKAAQVATVITYRGKGALRDAGRVLGYPAGAMDGWAKNTRTPPDDVAAIAGQLVGQPRHLGIHSGGMVICDRPIADVVPVEWARKDKRTVMQWDKDDCAAVGLVKFDLLGLGMLEALHHMIDLVDTHRGIRIDLADIDPDEPAVFDMLARADAVGVFQVESRAQMNTLPRLKPRNFFDLVVEVALIRPGPIQGGSVHPYIRRRNGLEEVTYDHPCLEKSLGKTLGIPLFQEQLMQIAVDAAGFTGAQADALRRAMGAKRSVDKMQRLKQEFFAGCAATHGIGGEVAGTLWNKMVAFAAYGFPESHSQSFAALVYYSAWFKYHWPAEFTTGLLKAQPMGFYSPQSLISDARRHHVTILPVDVNASEVQADSPDGCIRLGLDAVGGLGVAAARRIRRARRRGGDFSSIADLARRARLSVAHTQALAAAGACDCFGLTRRQAQWQAGVAATEQPGMLPGLSTVQAPPLPGMNAFEIAVADIAATGITPGMQPVSLVRGHLADIGAVPARELSGVADGTRIRTGGVVTHRQRPRTAGGVTFLGMEDETGLINVIVSPGVWDKHKHLALSARALIVRGKVDNGSGAVSVVADKLEPLPLGDWLSAGSRDFR
ncbi:error-prone DNA polymerase [Corynebacterium mendelii]|uniref:error-prone DNA polymerase n=3 Tax=Corynebacterium mendelii TaxID=2765362 RepID=UPI003632210A